MDSEKIFNAAKKASESLIDVPDGKINEVLCEIADRTERNAGTILEANAEDLARMSLDNPFYDRLKLDRDRITAIAADMRKVATLPSPLGQTLWEGKLPGGAPIRKISVPFGVIGIIYEARPNVSFDVFSLCIKSGNACILKGGSDAARSNEVIVGLIRKTLSDCGMNPDLVSLLPPGHESAALLLNAVGKVDLVIPRGGKGLIDFVKNNAKVPVIETGAGVCHTYFDVDGDLCKGAPVIHNAKLRRVSVCNALDCLIIHQKRLSDLKYICIPFNAHNVTVYADEPAFDALKGRYSEKLLLHADENSYGTEFLSYKMAIKTVSGLDEALEHIAMYSSKHSEAIITDNPVTAETFCRRVDAACVYTNTSTAFTDGGQFGFGAEIGISTQKLHARGPMGLHELTTYKYIITGNGEMRA